MCAIIGCYLEQPTISQIQTLKRLFVESQIRGKHATGYSVAHNGRVVTLKEPIAAEDFVNSHFAEIQPGEHTLQLAGHCRYSTSDLEYNQPIQVFDDFALCHNGVVDQRPPEYWKEYGYELTTANDSELLLQSAHAGKEPLEEFPEASIAACELHATRGLRWYRNGKRPLYTVKVDNGYFVCSTADIAKRSGLNNPERCVPGTIYTPHGQTKLREIEELVS